MTANRYFLVTHHVKAGKEEEYKALLHDWNSNATPDMKKKQTDLEDRRGFHSSVAIPVNDSLLYCVWQVRSDLSGTDLKNFLDSDDSFYTPVRFLDNCIQEMDVKHPSHATSGLAEFTFPPITSTETSKNVHRVGLQQATTL